MTLWDWAGYAGLIVLAYICVDALLVKYLNNRERNGK